MYRQAEDKLGEMGHTKKIGFDPTWSNIRSTITDVNTNIAILLIVKSHVREKNVPSIMRWMH